MEVSKGPGYRYYKTYLHPTHSLPGTGNRPWGTAEVVINGAKGLLICQTSECVSNMAEVSQRTKFLIMISNESTKEKLCAGELIPDIGNRRRFKWEFNIVYPKAEKRIGSLICYHIDVFAGQISSSCSESDGVLMQGVFSFPFEVRDSRIVGFKKEGTAKKPSREAWEKNPIIQKAEPFEPPIPNTIWWRISVQPDFRNFRQIDFCPRQKSYKAVF
jgi:hypothetical protein